MMSEQKKILIIEDELDFAKTVKMRLAASGYSVDMAYDAYSGTQKIVQNEYDLIILDLGMPAGGGFSILKRISLFPEKSIIPVIILTGRTIDQNLIDEAKAYNVTNIMNKPFDTEEFTNTVKMLTEDVLM